MLARIAIGALATVLILALVLLVLLNRGLELGLVQPLIERIASRQLNRSVTFDAPPQVQLGEALTLRVAGLRIANADWAETAHFLELDRAQIRIATRSLLSRPIDVYSVELTGLRLALEIDASGVSNTPDLGARQSGSDPEPRSGAPVAVDSITLRDIAVIRINRRKGTRAEFAVNHLDRQADGSTTMLHADGSLQEYAWTLAIEGGPLRSLVNGGPVKTTFSGSLAELELSGELALPSPDRLADATGSLDIQGSLPPSIAALSPLLDANEPISVVGRITDVKPGVRVSLSAELPQLQLSLEGEVDKPGVGDGLALTATANAGSFPRLASALDLGETADVPLQASTSVSRRGSEIHLTDLVLDIGEHRIRGAANFPDFPSTDAARFDLAGEGPDFAFYQRLFARPVGLPFPYELRAVLQGTTNGAQTIDGHLAIGETTLDLTGTLGEFPSYRNSDLRGDLRGVNLQNLGDSFGLPLPAEPYQATAQITIDDSNRITISAFDARSAGAHLSIAGAVNGWPALDDAVLEGELTVDSLSDTGAAFGFPGLGDVSATVGIAATGAPDDVRFEALTMQAGGLSARSRGELRITAGTVRSDLELSGSLNNLPELFGQYAPQRLPAGRFDFSVLPKINDDLISLELRELRGPGIEGSAELIMDSTLSIDERLRLDGKLQFRSLEELVPDNAVFSAADRSLELVARSRRAGGTTRIDLAASSDGDVLIESALLLPASEGDRTVLQLRGEGDDLQRLGRFSFAPMQALPYRINMDASWEDQQLHLQANDLEVDGTVLTGTADWDGKMRQLHADLQVPQGNLAGWWKHDEPAPAGATVKSGKTASGNGTTDRKKSRQRVIPDVGIPLDWLWALDTDIQLSAGPLGIQDPIYVSRPLIEKFSARLQSGQGSAQLKINEVQGSRGSLQGEFRVAQPAQSSAAGAVTPARFSLSAQLDELPLGITSRARDYAELPRHAVTVQLNGSGTRSRELAASLDGELLMRGGAGTLQDMSVSFATESFITQLLSAVLPGYSGSRDMQVECSVLAAHADAGRVSLNPGFVLRSQRVDLTARGAIDLRDESLGIRFDNQARKGLGISAASLVNPYVQITGTLAKPSLGLDITSSAISGGAAIATGGLTVLAKPLYGRFISRRDPCETALKNWEKSR